MSAVSYELLYTEEKERDLQFQNFQNLKFEIDGEPDYTHHRESSARCGE